jgi:hypothetical protein
MQRGAPRIMRPSTARAGIIAERTTLTEVK